MTMRAAPHLTELQESQERRNAASREIGNAMRAGDSTKAETPEGGDRGHQGPSFRRARPASRELDAGAGSRAGGAAQHSPRRRARRRGRERQCRAAPGWGAANEWNWAKEHFEIGEALGQMDFERAAKLSGARFTVLSGQIARSNGRVGQFMLDLHTTEQRLHRGAAAAFWCVTTRMYGTGQLPKFTEDLFQTREGFLADSHCRVVADQSGAAGDPRLPTRARR